MTPFVHVFSFAERNHSLSFKCVKHSKNESFFYIEFLVNIDQILNDWLILFGTIFFVSVHYYLECFDNFKSHPMLNIITSIHLCEGIFCELKLLLRSLKNIR